MWSRNLKSRTDLFLEELQKHLSNLEISVAIPKFHLPAHGSQCWSLYSMNFLEFWARVDGEAIERLWSTTNPIATSTREMTPGARHDFLEERLGASNFRKIIELGTSLAKKLRIAVDGQRRHSKELAEFSSAFDASTISVWTAKIQAWNKDPKNNPDPYQVFSQGMAYIQYMSNVLTQL
jgi:hypothetical protein